MAKRFLDLRGAKGPKLELDYLRLLYVVKELRSQGEEAQGYLLVLTPEIRSVTLLWQAKYEADEAVTVLVPQLSDAERSLIEQEIQANIAGMLEGHLGLGDGSQSNAAEGAAIGEAHLEALIKAHEPEVARVTRRAEFPFRIRWDYYGVAAANTGLNRTDTALSHGPAG
jgi:hypothetical protein